MMDSAQMNENPSGKEKSGKAEKSGGSGAKEKTGMDVAQTIKDFIKNEYPDLPEAHAMRLAVLLTKQQFKGEIK